VPSSQAAKPLYQSEDRVDLPVIFILLYVIVITNINNPLTKIPTYIYKLHDRCQVQNEKNIEDKTEVGPGKSVNETHAYGILS
jgi:hypothetical protein